jgi:hypothetical protein
MTHCLNGSVITGQASSIPNVLRTNARSSSLVVGVIRSTMLLGNETSRSIQSRKVASRSSANASIIRRQTSPLP